ncbi:hypothetical protein [Nocardioides sp.]|uniref:hypothetical protein n=1 Tax=Nocardioides sp. TaxID=35761 RepID=UPI0035646E6F
MTFARLITGFLCLPMFVLAQDTVSALIDGQRLCLDSQVSTAMPHLANSMCMTLDTDRSQVTGVGDRVAEVLTRHLA